MEKIVIEAKKRSETGKNVKKVRQAGLIPAIVYGRDMEPIPISLGKAWCNPNFE